ncbi:MAG: hypothetical protein U7126_12290 [Microcoleus sp.]
MSFRQKAADLTFLSNPRTGKSEALWQNHKYLRSLDRIVVRQS